MRFCWLLLDPGEVRIPRFLQGIVDFSTAPEAEGPYRIQAAFLYQTLSPRFAAELFTYSTSEVEAFKRYYTPSGSPPETMAALEIPFD